jgi:DHA1 family tetracycline resistance protein-like MFS transporter
VKTQIPAPIWLISFADATAAAITLPVVPKLIQATIHGDIALTALYYGTMLAVSGLILFFVSPIQAVLSDKFGHKSMLTFSCASASLSACAVAFAGSLPALFGAFILRSISGTCQPLAASYISEMSDPEKRTTNFARLSAAITLGFIVGASLGGWVGNFDLRLAMLTSFSCSLLCCFLVPTVTASALPKETIPGSLRAINPIEACRFLYSRAPLRELNFIMLCGDFAFQVFLSTWVLYSALLFHWSVAQAGASLSLQGVLSVIVQLVLLRYALPKFGPYRTLIASLLFDALALLLYNVIDGSWLVTVVIAIHACGAAVKPTCTGALAKAVSPFEQNKLQGAIATQGALNGIFAPLLGTLLFSYFTSSAAPMTLPGAPFFLALLAILASLVMAFLPFARSIRQGAVSYPT